MSSLDSVDSLIACSIDSLIACAPAFFNSLCARVVSFAARTRSARAANDTTRAQILSMEESQTKASSVILSYFGERLKPMDIRLGLSDAISHDT